MVSGFDPFDDILFDETVAGKAQAGSKFRPKAKSQLGKSRANVQLRNELPISRIATTDPDSSAARPEAPSLDASKCEGKEVDHSLPRFSSGDTTLRSCSSTQINTTHDSLVSQELLNHGETEASHHIDLRVDDATLEREEETFPGLEYFHMNSQANASPGNWDLVSEPSNYLMDRDCDNGDDVETDKQVRKRNISPEGLDVSNQEPRKKKFSHSTRRNRRRGDKALCETPAWETNPQKTVSERVTASSNFIPNQSKLSIQGSHYSQRDPFDDTPYTHNGEVSPFDVPYGQKDSFDSMQGQYPDDDQATSDAEQNPSNTSLSMTNRASNERWSKQDTELFYEGIRQFGTDFAMIQQLFPGRTRHQVKLKYKKEERRQPLRVHDAVTNRVKEFSHFELLIEKLKKAAAGVEHRDVESLDPTDGDEEDLYPEANEVTEKFDQEEQVAATYVQEKEEVNTTYSKRTTNEDLKDPFGGYESEEEDLYDGWNDYQG